MAFPTAEIPFLYFSLKQIRLNQLPTSHFAARSRISIVQEKESGKDIVDQPARLRALFFRSFFILFFNLDLYDAKSFSISSNLASVSSLLFGVNG